ncbi:WG repeat-containing protein [uncultured Bacteroides sp.]|uniref:WG repeat-containing protein n=1 Tax=uncultured Bacteroides sp. TaxID=162156 RepID=UPI0025F68630|nr:WG repeat-containing protein [uncultured Bacteroides sp.]
MEAHEFSCGLALVRGYDKKWRYINRKGEVVIEAPYDKCWSFGEFYESALGFKGLARVNNGIEKFGGMGWNEGGKYGLINTRGKVVLPVEYEEIINFDEQDRSRWMIKKDGMWGLIKLLVSPQYDKLDYYRGYACVEKQHRMGMIDKNGKVVIPLEYDSITRVSDNIIRAYKQGVPILMDRRGKVVAQ